MNATYINFHACIIRGTCALTVFWVHCPVLPPLQKYHWAEDAKWEAYYKSLEEKRA